MVATSYIAGVVKAFVMVATSYIARSSPGFCYGSN